MIRTLAYVTADCAVRALPAPLADALAVGIARVAFALRVPARRVQESNLRRLFVGARGRPVRAAARRAFEHFALSFVEFLRLGHPRPARGAQGVEVVGHEHLAHARASGRGVILISAHVGNWECGAAWLAARTPRLHLLARPHSSAGVQRFFERRRRAIGVRSLGERPLWRQAARALRDGEWVALMADRPGERGGSVCAWAAALARRTGALVLPAVIVRRPGGYAALIGAPVAHERGRPLALREPIRAFLRRYPTQWSAFEPLPDGLA